MSREEMQQILDDRTFQPFVLTTVDGFALAVNDPRKTLLGLGMVVIAHGDGRLYQIPLRSIAHVSESGEELG
jgi:hypothetical protein